MRAAMNMKALKVNNAKIATKNHFRYFQDLNREETMKNVEILIEKVNEARQQIVGKIEERKMEQIDILIQLNHLSREYGIRAIFDRRTQAIQYFQQVLHQLQLVELEQKQHTMKMNGLFHQLECGRNTLVVERKIIGAIKLCHDERRKKLLTADTDTRSKYQWYPWGIREVIKSKQPIEEIIRSKELIKEQIQLLLLEQKGLREQMLAYNSKLRMLQRGLGAAKKEINYLEGKLEDVNRKKMELYDYILDLRKMSSGQIV